MGAVPDGVAKLDGQSVGLDSANSLIALRSGDGRGVPWPYNFPSVPEPGVWILTPGAAAPATPWMGQMRPFTFDDPSQFLPDEPPPALISQTWTDDYNLTKTLGSKLFANMKRGSATQAQHASWIFFKHAMHRTATTTYRYRTPSPHKIPQNGQTCCDADRPRHLGTCLP